MKAIKAIILVLVLVSSHVFAAEPYIDKTKAAELKKKMAKENCETKFLAMRQWFPPKSDDVVTMAVTKVFPECSKTKMRSATELPPDPRYSPLPWYAQKPVDEKKNPMPVGSPGQKKP